MMRNLLVQHRPCLLYRAISTLGIAMLFLVSSCHPSDELMVPELNHDAGELLSFGSSDNESKEVIITTNQPKWDYTYSSEWLHIEKLVDRLIITADDNLGAGERETQVIITAGGILETINIRQAGQGVLINVPQTDLSFPAWEARVVLQVNSNAGDWHLKDVSAEWVHVIAEPEVERLTITVEKNSSEEGRTAQVRIVSEDGSVETTLQVQQEGKKQFILPFMKWGENFRVISALEQERQHRMVRVPSPGQPPITEDIKYYEFETQSDLFPNIRYEFMDYGSNFLYKVTMVAKDRATLESDEFELFMKESGFTRTQGLKMSSGVRKSYQNEDNSVKALVYVRLGVYELIFTANPKQTGSLPTLNKLYLLPEGIKLNESTLDELVAAEKEKGFVSDTLWDNGLTSQLGIPMRIFHDTTPFYTRWYYFNPEGEHILEETRFLFDRLDYGLYQYGGLYLLTEEFKALVKEAGFKEYEALRDPIYNRYYFYHPVEKYYLVTERGTWNGETIFGYRLSRYI